MIIAFIQIFNFPLLWSWGSAAPHTAAVGNNGCGCDEHAIPREHAYAECRALKRSQGCANIVQLVESFEDLDRVYLVLELCDGGVCARARARAAVRVARVTAHASIF